MFIIFVKNLPLFQERREGKILNPRSRILIFVHDVGINR